MSSGGSIMIAEERKLRNIIDTFIAVNIDIAIRFTPRKLYAQTANVAQGCTAIVRLDHSWFHYYACNADDQACAAFDVNIEEVFAALWFSDGDPVRYVCLYEDERNARGLPPPSELRHFVQGLGLNPLETIFHGLSSPDLIRPDVPWPEDDAIRAHAFKVQIHPNDWTLILQDAINYNKNVHMAITCWKVTLTVGIDRYELQVDGTVIQNRTCIVQRLGSTSVDLPSKEIAPFRFFTPSHWPLLIAVMSSESVSLFFTPKLRMEDNVRAPVFECILDGEESSIFYLSLENLRLN